MEWTDFMWQRLFKVGGSQALQLMVVGLVGQQLSYPIRSLSLNH